MRRSFVFVLVVTAFLSVQGQAKPEQALERPRHGLDIASIDRGVRPGDDFYGFANGGWQRTATIPADRSSWGTGSSMNAETRRLLRTLLDETAAANTPRGSAAQRVGAFYASALDTALMDRLGLAPIKPWLDSLDKLNTIDALLAFEQTHAAAVGGSFLSFQVFADLLQPTRYVLYLDQSNLGLPDAPYYTSTDSANVRLRTAYREYLVRLVVLAGSSPAEARRLADRQMQLETAFAAHYRDATAQRDIPKLINPRSVSDLVRRYPRLAIDKRLGEAGLRADTVVVFAPENLHAIDSIVGVTDVATLKTRLRIRILRQWAPRLGKPFRDAAFEYTGRALSGSTDQLPRWQTAVVLLDANIGQLIARLYVDRHFTPASRARAQQLVSNLKEAMRARLLASAWMTADTRGEALRKLDALRVLVGYPDKWETYDGLTVERDDLVGNIARADAWSRRRDARRLGGPVDPIEWEGTSTTVDAWANPFLVTITFPAAILQAPMFDDNADDAVNYGGIGMVIGHEIVHLFDDQGRLFDHTGTMRQWWTPADSAAFRQRTDRVEAQFNEYTVLDGLHVNGQLTLGENTADLGGITIAYEAFKRTPQGRSTEMKEGLTPDQRFFLAHAQNWRRLTRDKALRLLVQTDPHSPANLRVNGPLSNFDPFYAAFDLKPGDRMYRAPAARARVW